jgi:cytoskeletal protein CcmA (bactofilin family)
MSKHQAVQVLNLHSDSRTNERSEENMVPQSQPSILEEKVGRIQYGIGRGVSIRGGALRFERSARIDGNFDSEKGSLTSARVILITNIAKVKSTVEAETALVQGVVHGAIKAQNRVEIFSSARIEGDIEAPTVVVHDGAVINGFVKSDRMLSV